MSSRFPRLLIGPVAILVLGVAAVPASATFNRAVTINQSAITSGTLAPPTAPSGSCNGGGTANLSWTASTSSYRTGYTLSWTGTPSGTATAASTATSYSTSLTKGSSYTLSVYTTYRSWTSTTASVTFTC